MDPRNFGQGLDQFGISAFTAGNANVQPLQAQRDGKVDFAFARPGQYRQFF